VTLAELPIPLGWEEITPAWMTGAIRRRHPDAVVSAVRDVQRLAADASVNAQQEGIPLVH